jgi:hypothetical protein
MEIVVQVEKEIRRCEPEISTLAVNRLAGRFKARGTALGARLQSPNENGPRRARILNLEARTGIEPV